MSFLDYCSLVMQLQMKNFVVEDIFTLLKFALCCINVRGSAKMWPFG